MKLAAKLAEYLANGQFNLCYHLLLPAPGSQEPIGLADHQLLLLAIRHNAPRDLVQRLMEVPGLAAESDEVGCCCCCCHHLHSH